MKSIRTAYALLLVLSLFAAATGQAVSGPEQVRSLFRQYTERVPREEIYVHTDRNEYIGGEDLWFSIYVTDRKSGMPSGLSRVAYFEILNAAHKPVVQKRIRIDDGCGPGQCVIPDSLRTGTYTLRAYTSWMKNFLPSNCFEKKITVYNALGNMSEKVPGSGATAKVIISPAMGLYTGANIRFTALADNSSPDNLALRMTSDESWRSENNNQCFILIQTRGNEDYSAVVRLSGQNTTHLVPRGRLSGGINQVLIFSMKGQLVFSKYIYTPVSDPGRAELIAADSAGIRSPVRIDFGGGGRYSMSVMPVSDEFYDIGDYLLFGSEFGDLPWQFLGGRKISELSAEGVDSLLGSLESKWIDWNMILSGRQPELRWQAESGSHILSGRLIPSKPGTSLEGKFVLVSVPGKTATFQYGSCDAQGNFTIAVPIDGNLHDLVIQPDASEQDARIVITSSFSDRFSSLPEATDSAGRIVPVYVPGWSVNYQVTKIYETMATGDALARPDTAIPPVRFYGKPDFELRMDDYIKLPVMEEVFFELIQGAYLKKKRTGYEITVANPIDGRIYEMPPVIMIDGVIIHDPDIIGNLYPELVEKIDLVRERYFVGDYVFYGIINVITRRGDFEGFTAPASSVRLPYRVSEPVWSFRSPVYSLPSERNSRVPDFRNTMYWNHRLPLSDGTVRVPEFYSSDLKGEYVISIQGISADGKPVSARKILSVK